MQRKEEVFGPESFWADAQGRHLQSGPRNPRNNKHWGADIDVHDPRLVLEKLLPEELRADLSFPSCSLEVLLQRRSRQEVHARQVAAIRRTHKYHCSQIHYRLFLFLGGGGPEFF